MKPNWKHIACGLAAVMLFALFAILGGCAKSEAARGLCKQVDIRFKDALEFVSEEEVRSYLDSSYGPLIGMRLDSLELDRIEELLLRKKVLLGSEAWTTRDGVLHISIVQRAPVLRFQRGKEGFYVDKTGYAFPLHSSYTADVPVIEGSIPVIEKGGNSAWTEGMLELEAYIRSSKAWKGKVEKISVNPGGDVELHLSEHPERFIIGFPDAFSDKFAKIGKYFSHILPSVGEGCYKSVNLKYKNQIICRKDI